MVLTYFIVAFALNIWPFKKSKKLEDNFEIISISIVDQESSYTIEDDKSIKINYKTPNDVNVSNIKSIKFFILLNDSEIIKTKNISNVTFKKNKEYEIEIDLNELIELSDTDTLSIAISYYLIGSSTQYNGLDYKKSSFKTSSAEAVYFFNAPSGSDSVPTPPELIDPSDPSDLVETVTDISAIFSFDDETIFDFTLKDINDNQTTVSFIKKSDTTYAIVDEDGNKLTGEFYHADHPMDSGWIVFVNENGEYLENDFTTMSTDILSDEIKFQIIS